MSPTVITGLFIIVVIIPRAVANTNFQECYQQLQAGVWGLQGAVDFAGNAVSTLAQATGLTFYACQKACGFGSEPFDWIVFSQKFTAWALPFIALCSQLPAGGHDALSNLEAIFLSVGSPMLAAYSLALAVNSHRWMVKRFGRSNHLNAYFAAIVLGDLQQVSLTLAGDQHILSSLVALRINDRWWRKLAQELEHSTSSSTRTAIFAMVLVAISYLFTWINTVRCDLTNEASCSGQSFGSLWLSLIPIVVCNLLLNPKTDLRRISRALANPQNRFRIDSSGPPQHGNPLIIQTTCVDHVNEDVVCPTPVCFYARIFQWFEVAKKMTEKFETSLTSAPEMDNQPPTPPATEHSTLLHDTVRSRDDDYDLVFIIIFRSVLLAALLQWGTIGAAITSHYLTPTRGLGCRSGSYLLYAVLATLVWALAVTSSILVHAYSTSTKSTPARSLFFTNSVKALAIILRIAAKMIAALNAVWVFVFIVFQFSNKYNSCYCNSSALGLGTNFAYVTLTFTSAQEEMVKTYWTAGMLMSAGAALVFIIAFNVLKQLPQIPLNADQEGEEMLVLPA